MLLNQLQERFRQALDRLHPNGRVGLAVSGGPDSLALLLLAAEVRPAEISVATVDHNLRPEAAAEAAMVGQLCASRGIPHQVLNVRVGGGGSVQAQARDARYAALAAWAAGQGCTAIATAHHADDQAETLLMRLARGSGLAGLAGVREQRVLAPGVRLIRPLLSWRKQELVDLVTDAGLIPAEDPANSDMRHDRTRVRQALATLNWLDAERVALSAAALADAEEALTFLLELLSRERLRQVDGGWQIDAHDLPLELKRRLLLAGLEKWHCRPSGPDLMRAIRQLNSGGTATLGTVMMSGGEHWLLRPAPARRSGD